MKKFTRVAAVVLSAVMIFGSTVTAFAAPENGVDASSEGSGEILDFKVVKQVVPTALKVAINPNGYDVNLRYEKVASTVTGPAADTKYYSYDSENDKYVIETVTSTNWSTKLAAGLYTAETSDDQIVTFNYGIANKSTVARKITVKLDVEADEHIEFVSSEAAATAKTEGGTGTALRGEYKIYMELLPAKAGEALSTDTYKKATAFAANTDYYKRDASNKYTKDATITDAEKFAAATEQLYQKDTAIGTEILASELGDITMTASDTPIVFAAGTGITNGDVAYSLPKATYELKAGEFIDFDTTQAEIKEKFDITAIGGVSGFTISGTMNENAEWSLLETKTITITPTYAITDATGEEEAVTSGLNQVKAEARTPATVATSVAYTSKASNGDVTLTFTPGTAAKTLSKTSFVINGVETSGWSSYASSIVFNDDNTITVKAQVFGFSSITGATTDNKYTFTVKDTDGTAYSTAEVTIE